MDKKFDAIDEKFEAMIGKFEAKFEKFEAKFDTLLSSFENEKNFNQTRHKFLKDLSIKVLSKLSSKAENNGLGIIIEFEAQNKNNSYGLLTSLHLVKKAKIALILQSNPTKKKNHWNYYQNTQLDLAFIPLDSEIKTSPKYNMKIINLEQLKDAHIGKHSIIMA